jgi:predicted HTH transcriptional regulator
VLFFLRSLCAQKNVLERKVERERLTAPLPPLSEKLRAIAKEHGRVTTGSAAKLTGANRNTVKVHLRRLVAAGHLAQHGQGKGTWYAPGRR